MGQGAAEEQVPVIHHVAALREFLDRVPAVQKRPSSPSMYVMLDAHDAVELNPGVERAYLVLGVETLDVEEDRAGVVREHGEGDDAPVGRWTVAVEASGGGGVGGRGRSRTPSRGRTPPRGGRATRRARATRWGVRRRRRAALFAFRC